MTPDKRRYADGNHIYGGRGWPDFFHSGGIADGGIDLRTGVPRVLCASTGSAISAAKRQAKPLRRKGERIILVLKLALEYFRQPFLRIRFRVTASGKYTGIAPREVCVAI